MVKVYPALKSAKDAIFLLIFLHENAVEMRGGGKKYFFLPETLGILIFTYFRLIPPGNFLDFDKFPHLDPPYCIFAKKIGLEL